LKFGHNFAVVIVVTCIHFKDITPVARKKINFLVCC
jgi:hypothetical protein